MVLPLLISELSFFLMFGKWTNGSTLTPTIPTKFKSIVQVIKHTIVYSLVDIRVILVFGEFFLLLNKIVLHKVPFYSECFKNEYYL